MHSVESSPSMLASPPSGGLTTPNCVTRPNRVRMTLRLVRLPSPASAPVVAHQTLWVRLHDFRPFTMMNTFQFIRSAKLRLALSGDAEECSSGSQGGGHQQFRLLPGECWPFRITDLPPLRVSACTGLAVDPTPQSRSFLLSRTRLILHSRSIRRTGFGMLFQFSGSPPH